MKKYFSGSELYGDNFSLDEIKEWFKDEEEGYANLINSNKDSYEYEYHGINTFLGYEKLPKDTTFASALGVGAAFGEEFRPILKRIKNITILDPSDKFKKSYIDDTPINYIKPTYDGTLPFKDNSFDLITCFGTLHHIPNVSYVIKELTRTLKPGGFFLLREPIYSMGDWREKRPGLTKRERGIPIEILNKILAKNDLSTVSKKYCFHILTYKLQKIIKQPFNKKIVLYFDSLMSLLFSINKKYHRVKLTDKIAPTSVFIVVKKN